MNILHIIILSCVGLFLGMAIMPFFGYKIAFWQTEKGMSMPDNSSVMTVMSALFALLGLLIAFTFSGAFSRFEDRRQIIVAETNAISTAYARVDLLPQESQPAVREKFRLYTASRAKLFDLIVVPEQAFAELANSVKLQKDIWQLVVQATESPSHHQTRMLLLPALNEMFDITTTRIEAIQTHPPKLIYVALCAVALMCAGLLGYSANTSKRYRLSSVHVMTFASVIAFILYVILDVDFARYGLVRLDRVNEMLVELSTSM